MGTSKLHPQIRLLSIGTGILCAIAAMAQSPTAPLNCTRTKLLATVIDENGKPDLTLKNENFRVQSKGIPLKVTALKPQKLTPRMMIILDTSGSMIGSGPEYQKWRIAEATALGIIEAAKPGSPLALVTFNKQVNDKLDFSASKESLVHAIEEIKSGFKKKEVRVTALIDSVYGAIGAFETPQPGDTILLISDGGENRSRKTLPDLVKLVQSHQIRIFGALIRENGPPTPEEMNGPDLMQKLSTDTGGVWWGEPGSRAWAASPEALVKAKEIGRYLYLLAATNYQVEIQADEPLVGGAKFKLELVGIDGKRLRNRTAFYPHELLSCAEATSTK